MMKNYTEPKLEVLKFGVEDIMLASGEGFNPNATEGNNSWNTGGYAL